MIPSRIAPRPRGTGSSPPADTVAFGFQPGVEQVLIFYAGVGIACDGPFGASSLKCGGLLSRVGGG